MNSPVYLVAVVHVRDAQAFDRARRAAASATGEHGARFVARGSRMGALATLERVEGELDADHLTVIEYPSEAHARAWLASDAYHATRQQRAGTADFSLFLIPAVRTETPGV